MSSKSTLNTCFLSAWLQSCTVKFIGQQVYRKVQSKESSVKGKARSPWAPVLGNSALLPLKICFHIKMCKACNLIEQYKIGKTDFSCKSLNNA